MKKHSEKFLRIVEAAKANVRVWRLLWMRSRATTSTIDPARLCV